MLDNFGPIARTAPADYVIVDCEQRSMDGLTCNSVMNSNSEPAGNKSGWVTSGTATANS
eukprot:CAMPEP_0180152044 /NCGR_PEP_ID=MMETSP0986-20121125/22528_1 /TAXON_ID=697907 /ORGANISM="non described non described, Strain CCMP2293" /LENGTH=58 /DNA_ID=CAMNT_0022099531 /DNA_START=41 /DNA_END=217 /DNA_ORIENTATION=-